MAYNVYSLPDTRTVLYHPDVGTANIHQCGHGKITVSSAGDLTSHTTTADGYIVVGSFTVERSENCRKALWGFIFLQKFLCYNVVRGCTFTQYVV